MSENKQKNTYWFIRKKYGWGWVPGSWQGWATSVIYALIIFFDYFRVRFNMRGRGDILQIWLIEIAVISVLFLAICFWKGETPKWQWGEKPTKSKELDKNNNNV